MQKDKEKKRLNKCLFGNTLLCIFCLAVVVQIVYFILGITGKAFSHPGFIANKQYWIPFIIWMVVIDAVIFWIGIITVYIYSVQLGIRWRVIGLACGWIPIANIWALSRIIRTVGYEIKVEKDKLALNASREADRICQTKYPILMVHGVFFRDFKHLNYWGRIPEELEKNGATIFYGNHNSAASVDDSAVEIANRIDEILKETGAPKVNIIAHSKGGLDCRTAISKAGVADKVASLITINTPHRGCEFADYLLEKIPAEVREKIASTYNLAATALGDVNPDFLAAVYDLTYANCKKRNEEVFDAPGVYYSSVGSIQSRPTAGRFPLNMSYKLVEYFDGPNDGLVGEKSFEWGENFTLLRSKSKRGISHGDMIDLNREDYRGFDVREFFVSLVADLKNRGF